MQGGIGKRLLWGIGLFVMFLCWNGSLGLVEKMQARPGTADLRYEEAQATENDLRRMRKTEQARKDGEPVSITAWYQDKKAVLEAGENRKSAQTVWVDGSVQTLFSGALLSGQWLTEEDNSGCMISGDVAYSLFGNVRADGLEIEMDGKPYQIRGVLDRVREAVVLNNQETEEKVFTAFTLTSPESSGKGMGESFTVRQGMEPASVIVLSSFSERLAGFLSSLTTIGLMGGTLLLLLWNLWKSRDSSGMLALWGLILLGAIGAFVWIGGMNFTIPDSMIPSKWSDFEFWNSAFSQLASDFNRFFLMEKWKPDEVSWSLLTSQLWYSAGMTAALLVSLWGRKGGSLFFQEMSCILLAFGAALACARWGGLAETNRAYWFLLPVCLWLWSGGQDGETIVSQNRNRV